MDNINPGYLTLEVMLSNELHKCLNTFKHTIFKECFEKKQHGPATMQSIMVIDTDYFISIKSESWPNIANELINCNRQFGCPSQEMIYSIVKKRFHNVPVGSNRNHAEDIDRRLLFCTAEKQLIETFNHTHILVYGVLKLISKEIIEKQIIAQLHCSYFLKTVMFWVVEETSSSYWIPQNILLCIQLCIKRLIQFVIEENCPNYFVISNNMVRDRFDPLNKEKLLQVLCDIASNGWEMVLQTKTLERFPYFMTQQNPNILENTVNKKE
ncbi:unnamed protein product [Mytilus coruscus]|uniref:Mab-21-like HhH/H2TH-like domain-containing protein n=1 Tax=Mytilus coruscus TaxID=42192 RepID=A0A6J8ET04_MYTCO|nr:unnamed protein product [Mytilus coruscus]